MVVERREDTESVVGHEKKLIANGGDTVDTREKRANEKEEGRFITTVHNRNIFLFAFFIFSGVGAGADFISFFISSPLFFFLRHIIGAAAA